MNNKARSKADSLIRAFGWKNARMLCIEMNMEHFSFPNKERSEFWKAATKEVIQQEN